MEMVRDLMVEMKDISKGRRNDLDCMEMLQEENVELKKELQELHEKIEKLEKVKVKKNIIITG